MQFFKKKRTLTGRVIKAWEHRGWGNTVMWSDYSKYRVVGWLPNKPKVNDEIQFEMVREDQSTIVTRFIVLDVQHAGDPPDMFWAVVMPFAYVGHPIANKAVREAE